MNKVLIGNIKGLPGKDGINATPKFTVIMPNILQPIHHMEDVEWAKHLICIVGPKSDDGENYKAEFRKSLGIADFKINQGSYTYEGFEVLDTQEINIEIDDIDMLACTYILSRDECNEMENYHNFYCVIKTSSDEIIDVIDLTHIVKLIQIASAEFNNGEKYTTTLMDQILPLRELIMNEKHFLMQMISMGQQTFQENIDYQMSEFNERLTVLEGGV